MNIVISNYGQMVNAKTNERTNFLELENEKGQSINIPLTSEDLTEVIRLIGAPEEGEEVERDPVVIGEDDGPDTGLEDMIDEDVGDDDGSTKSI